MSSTFSKVFERDNHHCVYCGKNMLADLDAFMSAEEDHLLPRSAAGTDEPENIVTSCNVCNRLKGNFVPDGIDITTDRPSYVSAVRSRILERRAEKLKEFMSWATPDVPAYF